jgi:hypothetical protein
MSEKIVLKNILRKFLSFFHVEIMITNRRGQFSRMTSNQFHPSEEDTDRDGEKHEVSFTPRDSRRFSAHPSHFYLRMRCSESIYLSKIYPL